MKTVNPFEGSIVKNGMVPVCLNRTSDNSKVIVDGCNYNLKDYPKEKYTPIGIVVMDPLHTNARYREDDQNKGKYLILSLKHMDCDNVVDGTAKNEIVSWGCEYYDFPEFNSNNRVPTVNNTQDEEHVSGYSKFAYIPTTYNSNDGCATAPKLRYGGRPKSPSPYKIMTDNNGLPVWGVNPLYTEDGKDIRNILSDFEGRKNTENILSKTPSSNSENKYPAATCCNSFRTEGTNSGDWWLPSVGELGYCTTFFEENTATLEHINRVYEERICATNLGTVNWSSSVCSKFTTMVVSLLNGLVDNDYKGNHFFVRAVTAVSASTVNC